ncbi:MAG: hypothetical protein FWC00_03090 [Firmicutes bacterium]|nr:hypothetical protein [Bacillota bacterium]
MGNKKYYDLDFGCIEVGSNGEFRGWTYTLEKIRSPYIDISKTDIRPIETTRGIEESKRFLLHSAISHDAKSRPKESCKLGSHLRQSNPNYGLTPKIFNVMNENIDPETDEPLFV